MAKSRSIFGNNSGTVGDIIYYTCFGKSFIRHRNPTVNDYQPGIQLRQRAHFKAIQHTSAIYDIILQRGSARHAHANRQTRANEFTRIGVPKSAFVRRWCKIALVLALVATAFNTPCTKVFTMLLGVLPLW